MPETTLRCLGVDHRKGNGARDRSLSETSKLVGQTIGRALSGGTKPFVPNAEEGDKVPGGPVRAHTLFPAEILHRDPCFPALFPCTLFPCERTLFPALFSRRTGPLPAASDACLVAGSLQPLRVAAGLGVGAAAIATTSRNPAIRGVASAGALLLGAWLGATSVVERARM